MLLNEFIPVDKSSAIRAFLFSLLTDEKVEVICENELPDDAVSALNCLDLFGKTVEKENGVFKISGKTQMPQQAVDCGNSATMMHLLTGISVFLGSDLKLIGDGSLMSRDHSDFTDAAELYKGCFVETALTKESAQLKSFHLLAMLRNGGKLHFRSRTRRNTEELLAGMGVKLTESEGLIEVFPVESLHGYRVTLPKDPSSAFIAACAAFICGRSFEISDVYPERSRLEPFAFLERSGYSVGIKYEKGGCIVSGEPKICNAEKNIAVGKDEVAAVIDEIPFIAYMAARNGLDFRIGNAEWLRNKESDRISETVKRLSLMFRSEEFEDGFKVSGSTEVSLKGEIPHSFDHRMEMLSSLIALDRGIGFEADPSYKISFPKFYELLRYLKNE